MVWSAWTRGYPKQEMLFWRERMIKIILLIIVAILSVLGFISVILRLFSANPRNNKNNLELLILFLGLVLTLWQLNYFTVLIATLGALGVLLETKSKI